MVTRALFLFFLSLALLGPRVGWAQPGAGSPVLERYIQQGLASNLALKQEALEVRRVAENLRQARALFYPRVTFNPTYTVADGGRRLQFPVGDLLNPVYRTLNQMSGSDRFPSNIPNVNEQLNPSNFHDTKVEVAYSVFNTDLYYNHLIQQDLLSAQEARQRVVENELRYNIATAYYQYLQATEATRIYEAARGTLQELARLNRKLVANNVATRDVVASADYELSRLDQQLAEARGQRTTAQAYFNFLLNRDLSAEIETDENLLLALPAAPRGDLAALQQQALQAREELVQLSSALRAAQRGEQLQRANAFIPSVYVGGNLGFQGFGYEFRNQGYALGQAGLRWDLFKGYEKRSKIQQARIQTSILETRRQEAEQQIRLQVVQTSQELTTAREKLTAAEAGLRSARVAFEVIDARYRNGQALLLEFLKAQNDRTTAENQVALARTEVLSRQAAVDRVLAVK